MRCKTSASCLINCPLCRFESTEPFFEGEGRVYRHCAQCDLIFVPASYHLQPIAEKSIYDQHQNSPDDLGYRAFLNRLAAPVMKHLKAGSCGLDFGCGPGPALNLMFEEQGHSMALYDKFYADNPEVLNVGYDFVTSTEVVEHLATPGEQLAMLWGLLKPGGVLGIMTSWHSGVGAFPKWHYKRDPTHISFFSRETFVYLARQWHAVVEFEADVALLFKKAVR